MSQGMNVKVIGCGGIGTHLLDCLCQFLQYTCEVDTVKLTLVDGDTYEPRNRERQIFDYFGNKADVTADRLKKAYPGLEIRTHPAYLSDVNVKHFIDEGDYVLCCVDNHATRKLVSDRMCSLRDGTLISGGNELTDGNVMVHVKRDGEDLTMPIANKYHPEIAAPADENPADKEEDKGLGCGELVVGEPQLAVMNNLVAAHMLAALHAVMAGKANYDETYVDLMTNNSKSVKRHP